MTDGIGVLLGNFVVVMHACVPLRHFGRCVYMLQEVRFYTSFIEPPVMCMLMPLLVSSANLKSYKLLSFCNLTPSQSKLRPHLRHTEPGGHLDLKLDIILVKKIHVNRVVFQDQAM